MLFPSRKPYRSGFFQVGNGHELAYALYGNPNGTPVLFVHGGPGAGCSANAHRNFDPKKFNILTIDQRGAGKSRPFASTKHNKTKDLVDDFKRFLEFLNIKKTYLFGGSWGSCLSLCFAIKYPNAVRGMVLRGIYLGTRKENEYFLKGGAHTHFPEVWARFASFAKGSDPARYYWKMMNSSNKKTMKQFCREWARYETSMLRLEYNAKEIEKESRHKESISLARLEAYYLLNDCFLPAEYIIKNAKKIAYIPTSLVQGRYDFVCPPETAYKLHRALPKSKLFFVTAGHASSEPKIRDMMMKEIHRMAQ